MHPWLVRFVVPDEVPLLGGQDLSVPTLYALLVLGFFLATPGLARAGDRRGLPVARLLDGALIFAGVALVGGRLIDVAAGPGLFLRHPQALVDAYQGGWSLLGGALCGGGAMALFARRRGFSPWGALDALVIPFTLWLLFLHLGLFASGGAIGQPVDVPFGVEWPWGVVFYSGRVPVFLQGVVVHPYALYLLIWDGLLLLLLRRWARASLSEGALTLRWLMAYGLATVALDVFRAELGQVMLGVGLTMWVGLIAGLLGLFGWFWQRSSAPTPDAGAYASGSP